MRKNGFPCTPSARASRESSGAAPRMSADHFGDSGLVQAPENRLAGPVAEQLGGSAPQIAARLGGAEGQHPADRQRSQPGRQGAYRRPGAAVSPLQVVEADQDRLAQSGLLEQRLDVLQQPVTLLAGGVRSPSAERSSKGSGPPNSASISTASSTAASPGSATPWPTANPVSRAADTASSTRRLLPSPGPPSISQLVPAPLRSRAR